MPGLKAVAKAINRGQIAHAMVVTQFLHLPTLPGEKAFERAVKAETLAKAGFNTDQARNEDGRWSSDGVQVHNSNFIPVQAIVIEPVIPFLEQIRPVGPLPNAPGFPGDILPPITGNPDIAVPRTSQNPYPKKRGCDEEWAEATRFCFELKKKRLIGKDGYRGMGKNLDQCIRGQLSERCGGNSIGT